MESLRVHDHDPLLERLRWIYGWILQWKKWASPIARRTSNIKLAQNKFGERWSEMRPIEREEAFDIVLGSYCALRASRDSRVPWRQREEEETSLLRKIQWTAIAIEIGYLEYQLYDPEATIAIRNLNNTVQCILGLFPVGVASHWAEALLHTKLTRADTKTLEALARQLGALETDIASQPPSQRMVHALPSEDALLATAQLETQPPEVRFHAVKKLFNGLCKLYTPTTDSDGETAQLIRDAVSMLERHDPLENFKRLSHRRQEHALNTVRGEVFHACEQLEERGALPDISQEPRGGVIGRCFDALLNPELEGLVALIAIYIVQQLRAGTHTAHSFAHISGRYARRYYGTTAQSSGES